MTVLDAAPTSNQHNAIPTQTSPKDLEFEKNLANELRIEDFGPAIDMVRIKARLEAEKGNWPESISILREVYMQTAEKTSSFAQDTDQELEGFTNRAIITYEVYSEMLLDPESPTGKNRDRHEELIDGIEQFKEKTFMVGLDQVTSSIWAKSGPNSREHAIEAYALGSIMTLDAYRITLDFMRVE